MLLLLLLYLWNRTNFYDKNNACKIEIKYKTNKEHQDWII